MSESMAFIDLSSGNSTAVVNGHLTARPPISGRSFYRPMSDRDKFEEILRRVDKRLRDTGLSDAAASKAAKRPDAIRNMRRALRDGQRQGVTVTTLGALAPVLKTTSSWLLDGTGPETEESAGTVPLVGYVGAGSETHFYGEADDPHEEVPAPDNATDSTVAVEVRGESLGPFFDSWRAYYDDVRRPVSADLMNRLCVVGLADGRVLIKKLQKAGRKGRYHLISQTESPILDAVVEWAAEVKAMLPA